MSVAQPARSFTSGSPFATRARPSSAVSGRSPDGPSIPAHPASAATTAAAPSRCITALMTSGGSEVVALAHVEAVVAQDVVGGGDVEVEVRDRASQQELHAAELRVVAGHLDRQLLVLGAVDLLGLEGLEE